MTTWTISINHLNPPELGEALQAVRMGLEELNIDFYLIGAVARDLYLGQIHNQKVSRPTMDLDVAVLVATSDDYEQLKQHLIHKHNFRETATSAFALLHPNRSTVDLMPFGEIAGVGGWVKVKGRGMTSISLPGMTEAYEEAGELQTDEGQRWRVCTLPGMCVLKLLAWQDRPESRSKDLQDLAHILTHYEYVVQDELFMDHYDLLIDESIDSASPKFMLQVSARIIGRHMQAITRRSGELHQRIINLLQIEKAGNDTGPLSQAWAKVNGATIEEALDLLSRLLQGLTEDLPNR